MPLGSRYLKYLLSIAVGLIPVSLPANQDTATPADLRTEYIVDSWQTEQGLPDNFINAVAQTPDGYLWVATFNGLSRFNGTQFITFDVDTTPELESSRIPRLLVDHQGRLWILQDTGALAWYWHGHFKKFDLPMPPRRFVRELRQDAADDIWADNPNCPTNYFRLSGDHFESETGPAFMERFGRWTDSRGRGWDTSSNCVRCVDPANPVAVVIPGVKSSWRVIPSRDGSVWVVGDRILKFGQGRWTDLAPEPILTDRINQYAEDQKGALWVGTDSGEIWRFDTNGECHRFTVPNATTPQVGLGLAVDAEGNIWFGTGGSGLFRIKPRVFRNYNSRDGLASDLIRSVTQDGAGNIWFASVNRLDWIPNGSKEIQSCNAAIVYPWEVFGAHEGGVWVATYLEGLYRVWPGKEEAARYPDAHGYIAPINALLERRNGEIELGTPHGLMQLTGLELTRSEVPPGITNVDVRAIAEDTSGHLYLGLESQGFYSGGTNGWKQFTTNEGLASDQVRALFVDDANVLWIGTHGGGLSRFQDGRVFSFTAGSAGSGNGSGIPRAITSILEDDHRYLWLASNQGLYRVKKDELNRLSAGEALVPDVLHYDRSDGMGSSQCMGDHQPAACKARDGKLWFATMNGVTVVDPAALAFNPRQPPVHIEGVFADDSPQTLATNEASAVDIPAGTSRLEIHYAALTFVDPEKARFRYRLENFDQGWIPAESRRVADYTKVPPGLYHFHVIAANKDNVWNEQGASIAVRVLPLFWQTTWFRSGVALAVLGAAIGSYHLRVRRLQAARAMQEAFSRRLLESQEAERKRMAAELHDSLGQSLLVVSNYAALALKEAGAADKLRERLRKISDGASACIEEIRAIVRSLRPYQLDRFGLSKTLEDVADLLSHTAGLAVTTEIENLDGLFPPEAEISIYRVAQEWLNNVVKHAHATSARLAVRREAGCARMVLEDNGDGFDYDKIMAGTNGKAGFGLANLRERVRLLGGSAEIESARGQGTRWIVVIPYEINHHGFDRR